ncbi:MAG: hypothetical protein NTZ33_11490 [Bacteroidetes bacterium]|nr:hypothetical protein [Bacteroidota bacterium]
MKVAGFSFVRNAIKFDFDLSYKNYSTKDRFKLIVEKISGYRIGEYKNYKVV